jgi:hypothetical protein
VPARQRHEVVAEPLAPGLVQRREGLVDRSVVGLDAVPPGRTVLRFAFRDVPAPGRDWWLVITRDGVDPCDTDPGFPVTATIETDLRTLTLIWRGDLAWTQALRSGALDLQGPAQARRAVPRWLKLSAFAPVPRPA